MICDRCRGIGLLTYDELHHDEQAGVGFGSVFPCPDCIGGVSSCCEVTDDPEANAHEPPKEEQ